MIIYEIHFTNSVPPDILVMKQIRMKQFTGMQYAMESFMKKQEKR